MGGGKKGGNVGRREGRMGGNEGRQEGEKDRRKERGERKQNHKPKTREGYTLGERVLYKIEEIFKKKKVFCTQ